MKIRLMGTKEECAAGLALMRPALDIVEVSEPHPNRGDSSLVRIYIDAPGTTVHTGPRGHAADGRSTVSERSTDLQMGDALLDALDLTISGDKTAAGLKAIPWLKRDPVSAGSFLLSLLHTALGAYAREVGRPQHQLFAEIWSKPTEDGGGR